MLLFFVLFDQIKGVILDADALGISTGQILIDFLRWLFNLERFEEVSMKFGPRFLD